MKRLKKKKQEKIRTSFSNEAYIKREYKKNLRRKEVKIIYGDSNE